MQNQKPTPAQFRKTTPKANTPPKPDADQLIQRLTDLAGLPKAEREQFILEKIEESLPSAETMQKMADILAKTRYTAFKAYVDAGFSEAQAMILCQSK